MKSIVSHSVKAKAAAVICLLGITAGNLQASDTYKGYQLYNQTCYLCHGEDGKGKGPLAEKLDASVSDLTDSEKFKSVSDQWLFRLIQGTIKHGSGNDMPQWGLALADPQIDAIVSYVRFLQRSAHQLPGDPELGEQIYMSKCAACHGRHGKGDGLLTDVMKIKPTDHTDSGKMNKVSNTRMTEVITYGTTGNSLMPGWEGRLSEEEIAGVVSYIRLLSQF